MIAALYKLHETQGPHTDFHGIEYINLIYLFIYLFIYYYIIALSSILSALDIILPVVRHKPTESFCDKTKATT